MACRFLALLAVLALAGCDLGGGPPERRAATASEATTTAPATTLTSPQPSRTELVVQAIRSCEVKRIFFLHGGETWITFRRGRTVHTKHGAKQIERAAWEHADDCNMVIGME